jgi:hypothetical protein
MGLHSIGTSYCCMILEKWYKYETAVIVQWLEGEDELVRDRINQLLSLKNNNSTIEETR